MGQDVTRGTRYPASVELIDEMKRICGSYNKAAQRLGIPWATIAMVTSHRKPLPLAAVVLIAEMLARDPLIAIAKVEAEHTQGWIGETWRGILRRAGL